MVLPEVTTLAEARNAIRDLAEENEKLRNELAWFRRQLFGSKTEHYIPRDDTPSLFPEEMSPESPKEVPTATVAEHERKVRQANALSEIPGDLPREERVIDVPEEERLGGRDQRNVAGMGNLQLSCPELYGHVGTEGASAELFAQRTDPRKAVQENTDALPANSDDGR